MFWRIVLFIPIAGPVLYLTLGSKVINLTLNRDTKRYWDRKTKHDRFEQRLWIESAQEGDGGAIHMICNKISLLETEENETQMQIDAFKENMSELEKMTMESKCELDDLMRKLASIQPQKQELHVVLKDVKDVDSPFYLWSRQGINV